MKEQGPKKSLYDKFTNFEKKVGTGMAVAGVGMLAFGAIALGEALLVLGGVNVAQGYGMDKLKNYFKSRRERKQR